MSSFVLGVDPGVVSGWALVGGHPAKPLLWGQTGRIYQRKRRTITERGTGADVHDVLQRCGELVGDAWPPTLAIEGQFVPHDGGQGQAHRNQAVSTLLTARHAGIWIGVCQRYGLDIFEHKGEPGIPPQTWRGAVWGGRWRTEQAKRWAVETAENAWGIRILKSHHHTAEACWIAMYAHGEIRAALKQQGLPGVMGERKEHSNG